MIPEETIAQIRERAAIADVIGEYVTLKKSGKSYRGLCPFHGEKTPSFYVHPDNGFYHCFGCKASGDVFSFLMQIGGKTFPETARELAERTNVEIPVLDAEAEAAHQRKRKHEDRLADLMDLATRFYEAQLLEHPHAKIAQAELQKRGVNDQQTKTFRLGYAPAGWDALANYLSKQGASPADAEALGLVVSRRGSRGYYDRFRHRLMFPISDLHGRVVAFSGRALAPVADAEKPADPPAKYINSPEGPLYTKGQVLFGLHQARVAMRREGLAIVCEGNFDLVALHQAGCDNAVAPLGTAFTESHAKLLRRFTDKVVLLFDGDKAGAKAVRDAYPLFEKVGLTAHVATLPEGADPDSFLREHGVDALRTRLHAAPGIVSYFIDRAASLAGTDARARAQSIGELAPILAGVPSPIERKLYVEQIAQRFQIGDVSVVRQELRRGLGDTRSARPTNRTAVSAPPNPLQSNLISLLIAQPQLIRHQATTQLLDLLTSADLRAILIAILQMVETRGGIDAAALLTALQNNPYRPWLETQLVRPESPEGDAECLLQDGVLTLARQKIERQLPLLQQQIVEARHSGDDDLAAGLTQEFIALSRSALTLKGNDHSSRKR